MPTSKTTLAVAALLSGATMLSMQPVAGAPLTPAVGGQALTAQADAASSLIEVRSRGSRIGAAVAVGVASAIIGGIIASQDPYAYPSYVYPPYPYRPYRYPPYSYAYPSYPIYSVHSDAVAYCMSRFRSYDPYSMTYLGYDGLRHPCP